MKSLTPHCSVEFNNNCVKNVNRCNLTPPPHSNRDTHTRNPPDTHPSNRVDDSHRNQQDTTVTLLPLMQATAEELPKVCISSDTKLLQTDTFIAGNISSKLKNWQFLTTDKNILSIPYSY